VVEWLIASSKIAKKISYIRASRHLTYNKQKAPSFIGWRFSFWSGVKLGLPFWQV